MLWAFALASFCTVCNQSTSVVATSAEFAQWTIMPILILRVVCCDHNWSKVLPIIGNWGHNLFGMLSMYVLKLGPRFDFGILLFWIETTIGLGYCLPNKWSWKQNWFGRCQQIWIAATIKRDLRPQLVDFGCCLLFGLPVLNWFGMLCSYWKRGHNLILGAAV